LVQRDIGRLARYTADMGGPAELLEVALRIPPWEPMHALTRAELQQMGFEPQEKAPADVPTGSVASSVSYTPTTAGNRSGGPDEHGWAMVERAGASMLGRRHPLTIDGDEIGSFDLVLACAGNDGNYLVTYSEERRADIGAAASPLTEVTIRVGAQTMALKVVSSEVKEKSGVLATVAAGVLPASSIRSFSANGSRSMMIATSNAKTHSTIRLGNSGAQRNMPMLTSQCQKAQRAELVTAKTGGLALK
jgi:hypothetical protein